MSNVKDPNASGLNEDNAEPSYVTKEELASIVNSAITGHLKRLNVSKQVSEALEASLAPFKEQLGRGSEAAQADKPTAPVASPEVSALQKKLEAMEKQMAAKELALSTQAKAVREKEAFSQLKAALSGKVRPEAVDHAAKLLFHADKRVKVDDEGQVTYTMDDDSSVDLDSGIKHYLKSKDASIFLPAPTAKPSAKAFPGAQSLGRAEALPSKPTADQAADVLSKLGLTLK